MYLFAWSAFSAWSACVESKRDTVDTVLHTRKYLAVSAGLNRIVSVRNSWIAPDGRYPLRFQKYIWDVFGLSSLAISIANGKSNYLVEQDNNTM